MINHYNQSRNINFVCDLCSYKSFNKRRLTSHMFVHMEPRFKCSKCPKKFKSSEVKRTHEQRHSRKRVRKSYSCECGKVYSDAQTLKLHKLKFHQGIGVRCDVCRRLFDTNSNMRKHFARKHGPKHPCEICGEMIRAGGHRMRHEPAVCDVEGCNREFPNQYKMRYHKKNDHTIEPVYCPTCNAEFPNVLKLQRHININHRAKVFCKAEGCNYTTNRRDYLAMHYRNHKGIDEECRKTLLDQLEQEKGERYD
jgi:uncharacterized Zn-finger protein